MLQIVQAYKQNLGLGNPQSEMINVISTPSKRRISSPNIESLIKKEKLYDSISNSSFFSGLVVNTLERERNCISTISHSTPISHVYSSQTIFINQT